MIFLHVVLELLLLDVSCLLHHTVPCRMSKALICMRTLRKHGASGGRTKRLLLSLNLVVLVIVILLREQGRGRRHAWGEVVEKARMRSLLRARTAELRLHHHFANALFCVENALRLAAQNYFPRLVLPYALVDANQTLTIVAKFLDRHPAVTYDEADEMLGTVQDLRQLVRPGLGRAFCVRATFHQLLDFRNGCADAFGGFAANVASSVVNCWGGEVR